MSKEVVITNYKHQHLIVSLENNKPIEIFLTRPNAIEIGDVYIGKVKNIVDNIQAAFIEVSPGVVGYYSLKSNTEHLFTRPTSRKLCAGDEIVVQVERGSIKSKQPVLTSRIQLQGQHVVFLANHTFVGVSKKISHNATKERMKNDAKEIISGSRHGIIYRTEAANQSYDNLVNEYRLLEGDYNNIMSISKTRTCYSKLFSAQKNWLDHVHASPSEELRVVTDIREVYEELMHEKITQNSLHRVEFYNDDSYPLIKLKSFETQIERILSKHVWLRSGASLVIEPTEALTSIDINTSKTEIHKKNEDAFLQINLEAAREVCRQIRLRNLSGIIIVDFINMKDKMNNERLMEELKSLVKYDPVQTNVIDMTPLGLVEITRKRTYRPFHEQIKELYNE